MKKLLPLLFIISCTPKNSTLEFSRKLNTFFTNQVPVESPGGAVLILKDTAVVFSAARGWSDLATREPITTQSLFNLGSISKTFVANGILILKEEGKLSLEDSLLKYFPGFKNKKIAQTVKIKHLLTHTSGLPDNRPIQRDSVFYLTANDEQNWYPVTQTDTLEFEPGSRYHYSNPAFNALALIIEQVSGQPWQDFISERIFKPSGMISSTITNGPHPDHGVVHAYTKIAGEWREDDYGEEPTFCAAGNGGVWSSVEELAKYELALRRGVFLSTEAIHDSRTIKDFSYPGGGFPADRGWSWQVTKTSDGLLTAEHTGHQGGFAANYISIPEKRILVVVLYNAPYDVYAFRESALSLLKASNWLE